MNTRISRETEEAFTYRYEFALPGGEQAWAAYREGYAEGHIFTTQTWINNSDERTRGIGEGRADKAAGVEGREVVWFWNGLGAMK